MKKSLFDILSQVYGEKYLWTEVESVLKSEAPSMSPDEYVDPFKNLIIGILSQNTSDANCTRAYIGLTKKFEITPKTLVKADVTEIRQSIKSGGLYNLKSKRIKKFSKAVLEKFGGDFTKLMKMPEEEAREKLLELPGIGPKTADVWLSVCGRHGVMAVDTHIKRVTKRLGIVPPDAPYEQIKEALEKIFPSGQRLRGHELLIRLGRDYCKSRQPLCKSCPVKELCQKNI